MPKKTKHSKAALTSLTKLRQGHGGQVLPNIKGKNFFNTLLTAMPFGKNAGQTPKDIKEMFAKDVANIKSEGETKLADAIQDIKTGKGWTKIKSWKDNEKSMEKTQSKLDALSEKKKLTKKEQKTKTKLTKELKAGENARATIREDYIKIRETDAVKANKAIYGLPDPKKGIEGGQKYKQLEENASVQTQVNQDAAVKLAAGTLNRTVRGIHGVILKNLK